MAKWKFRSTIRTADTELKEKVVQTWKGSLAKPGELESVTAFSDFVAERKTSIDAFASMLAEDKSYVLRTPDGTSVADKLKAPGQEFQDLKTDFAQALTLDGSTNDVKIKFEGKLKALNTLLKQKKGAYDSASVASYLQEQRTDAQNALKHQHSEEIRKVNALFNIPPVAPVQGQVTPLDRIKITMGLDSDQKVDQFRKDTIAALEKSHKEEFDKFSKALEDDVNKLHQQAQKERDRVFFFGQLYKNEENKANLDKLRNKKLGQGPALMAVGEDGTALFKNLNLLDLKKEEITNTFKTITGRDVTMEDDGTFKMKMSWSHFLPWPWKKGEEEAIKKEFANLAEAVRACGHDSIIMTIDLTNNPEKAMELGRLQYEAAVSAGFDPTPQEDPKDPKVQISNITIKVNGKEIPAAELFEKQPSRLQAAQEQYKKDTAKRLTQRETHSGAPPDISKMRAEVEAERVKQEKAKLPAAGQAQANLP